MNVNKLLSLAACCMLLTSVGIHAQSADTMDILLASDSISIAEAAYIVLGAAGHISPDDSTKLAFDELRRLTPAFTDRNPETSITIAELSLIGMKAFDVPPGILFRLTGAARYAFRDVRHRNILQDQLNPADPVSGSTAIRLTGRFNLYVERGRPARL